MNLNPDPSLTAASLSDHRRVPPLKDPKRFELAAYGAFGAWWEYDHATHRHDDPPLRRLPAPPATDSLFQALLDGGPERWRHVRARFEQWYRDDVLWLERAVSARTHQATCHAGGSDEAFQNEREAATHRFVAIIQLVDSARVRVHPDLAPWVWPEPPLRVRPPLLTAAAQASLVLSCSCVDNPMDECSIFDPEDLVARVRVAAEQEQIDRGFHYALANLPAPPASFFSQAEP